MRATFAACCAEATSPHGTPTKVSSVLSVTQLKNDKLVLHSVAVIEFVAGGILMRYSVLLEPINEADFQGYYYAHIPTLDLTTHGQGIEGALAVAQDLVTAWIGEKRAHGEDVARILL